MKKNIRTLIVMSLVLAACGRTDDPTQIVGTLERDRLELTAEAHEPISEILVREGDLVQAGAKLLQQESGPMHARLEQAIAAQSVAERRLAELVKGARAQEINEARAALESAESALITESNEYKRVQDLVTRKLLSESDLDQARTRRDTAAGTRKQAAARLNLLLEGTRREEIEQAEATLKQAQAALAELQVSADRYTVAAPRAGRIEAIPYKLGERPPAGAPLIIMLAEGRTFARVHVPELRRADFMAGKQVRVKIDGRDTFFNGVVRFVSAEAAFTPYYALTQEDRSRLSYLAEIDLTDAAATELPAGIPVQVTLSE